MNHPLNLTTGQKVDICCAAGAAATGQKCRVAVGTVERLTKTRAIVRNDSTQSVSSYRLSDGGKVGGGDYSIALRPAGSTENAPPFEITLAGFPIRLDQDSRKRFRVTYGMEIRAGITHNEAASFLGGAILHALACEGKINNSGT